MKKIIFFLFLFFPVLLFSQVFYKFQQSKPLNYSFQIDGKGSLTYPGVKEEKFNVIAKGNLKIELVGFATCNRCPGGNVEYAPAEMKKNGAEMIHLATGMVVGSPCLHIK